ncbi:MAG: hypothetical protein CMI52_01355 [Parcubacteria group bacterium]|nr:hypothetical protein [Parcubacteria group bacterium]
MNAFQLFFLFIRLPLDYIALLLAAITAYTIRLSEPVKELRSVNIGLNFEQYMQAAVVIAVLWLVIFAFAGLYSTDPNRKFSNELNRIFIACSAGFAAVAVVIFLRGELFNSRFIVLAAWGISIVYLFVARLFVRLLQQWLHAIGVGNLRVVVIGDDAAAVLLSDVFAANKRLGSRVMKTFKSFNGKVADSLLKMKLKDGLDEIVFTNADDEKETLKLLAFCEEHHVTFKYAADLFATYAPARAINVVSSVPLIEIRRTRLFGWGRILKRLSDVVISLLLIILLSPILILIAVFVMFETGFPLIFKNKRVGARGTFFNTLKFRTMHQKYSIGSQFKGTAAALKYEKELIAKKSKKQGPVYKVIDDPRVTRVGKFLRRWSLDELPQLFNVLFGSMSLVGPRPHQPREVEKYESHHKKVLAIKPGITGLSQISGRSDLSFEEEVQLDTLYIEQWSPWTDLFILMKTPFAVIKRDGAY